MKTRENNPGDWFFLAEDRLKGADALWRAEGITFLGIEALHEGVERYLKGFLVAKGSPIRRTHDLGALLDAAVIECPKFKAFADLCESLTDQFWAQHYPGGNLEGVGSDYPELRKQVGDLVALIKAQVADLKN